MTDPDPITKMIDEVARLNPWNPEPTDIIHAIGDIMDVLRAMADKLEASELRIAGLERNSSKEIQP